MDHPKHTRFICSVCERDLPFYDHAEEREWRHLDSCRFLTFLRARSLTTNCPEHGVIQVRLPSVEPMGEFTKLGRQLVVADTTTARSFATKSDAMEKVRLQVASYGGDIVKIENATGEYCGFRISADTIGYLGCVAGARDGFEVTTDTCRRGDTVSYFHLGE